MSSSIENYYGVPRDKSIRKKRILPLFVSLSVMILMSSCQDDEVQAFNSLKGSWKVTQATTSYAVFTEFEGQILGNGGIDSSHVDSGNLGFFNFMNDEADFSYTRKGTLREGRGNWILEACKVRVGFFRTTEFSLEIQNHFLFDVQFEDGTRNSEKNAKYITLSQYPTEPGPGMFLELMLEKL